MVLDKKEIIQYSSPFKVLKESTGLCIAALHFAQNLSLKCQVNKITSGRQTWDHKLLDPT